ncbi:MAG TPA: molybdenum cofactor biosynthesis protein MoaE [Blastocatellia bacterium]|nr:molybdenum cofactor biosynthesis protein MoaE [Blastocatellia bacterium]
MAAPDVQIVEVLFFGHARELAGVERTSIEVSAGATVGDAMAQLQTIYPALAPLEGVLLAAVNETYAVRSESLAGGDTLAIFPPVSGGSGDFFEITHDPIGIEAMRGRLLRGEDGAVVIFDGVARNNTRGRSTRFLEYEGYEEMAIRTMEQIGAEAHERWPGIDRIGITHRLGRIEIGESSVVIVVTSAHRKVAFEAGQFAIDRLKQIVPIWKKEHFEDGAVWVQGESWPEVPPDEPTS